MSINFGGSESKSKGSSTVLINPASKEETDLKAANLRIAQEQLAQMQAAAQEDALYKSSPQYATDQAIQQKASQNILARLTGQAPVLTPEEQARLDEVYNRSNQTGMDAIRRYAEEQAAARGMRTSDSPIGNETLRQIQEFQAQMGANKAAAALNLGDANAQFQQGLMTLQNNLRQQSFQNKLALSATAPATYGMENSLFAQRLAGSPRSYQGLQSGSQWGYGVDLYKVASAAGSAYGGA